MIVAVVLFYYQFPLALPCVISWEHITCTGFGNDFSALSMQSAGECLPEQLPPVVQPRLGQRGYCSSLGCSPAHAACVLCKLETQQNQGKAFQERLGGGCPEEVSSECCIWSWKCGWGNCGRAARLVGDCVLCRLLQGTSHPQLPCSGLLWMRYTWGICSCVLKSSLILNWYPKGFQIKFLPFFFFFLEKRR